MDRVDQELRLFRAGWQAAQAWQAAKRDGAYVPELLAQRAAFEATPLIGDGESGFDHWHDLPDWERSFSGKQI